MKRTSLARKTPLRRKTRLRARGDTAYRRRERDLDYMRWVITLPCAARRLPERDPCSGRVEADHAGRRPGVGMKAADRTCIPLCSKHHRHRDNFHGMFRTWTGAQMRVWLDSVIQLTQRGHDAAREAGLACLRDGAVYRRAKP